MVKRILSQDQILTLELNFGVHQSTFWDKNSHKKSAFKAKNLFQTTFEQL